MSALVNYDQPGMAVGSTTLILGISSSLLVSGLHFGASLLTMPSFYKLPADTSTQLFSQFYQRSTRITAPLTAFATAMFGLSAYFFAGERYGLQIALAHAAGLTFSTFLWTRLVMMRVNRALLGTFDGLKLTDEVDQAEVELLLRRWKRMNLLRGCLTTGGGLVGLVALATRAAVGG